MNKYIVLASNGDWDAVYVDKKLVLQDRSLCDAIKVLKALDIAYEYLEVDCDLFDEKFKSEYPENLKDLEDCELSEHE